MSPVRSWVRHKSDPDRPVDTPKVERILARSAEYNHIRSQFLRPRPTATRHEADQSDPRLPLIRSNPARSLQSRGFRLDLLNIDHIQPDPSLSRPEAGPEISPLKPQSNSYSPSVTFPLFIFLVTFPLFIFFCALLHRERDRERAGLS